MALSLNELSEAIHEARLENALGNEPVIIQVEDEVEPESEILEVRVEDNVMIVVIKDVFSE